MASVILKRGKWWIRIKGNKTPGRWSTHPTSEKTREDALKYAHETQVAIDRRNVGVAIRPRGSRRARINTKGIIYAIRLLPDLAPNRLKVGFTSSPIERRLAQHRVTCPGLVVIARWRAYRRDETRAHAVLDGRLGLNEIFDVADVSAALAAIDALLGERI